MAKVKKQIKVIYKRVGFDPVEVIVPNTLDHLQVMVGGDIEAVRWPAGLHTVLLVDDEGKLKHRPANFFFHNDVIVGSAMWAGVDGENFTDCPYNLDDFRKRWPFLFEEDDEVDE